MMKDKQNLEQAYIGTYFDRQVRIEDWDQNKLSQQTVLILGIGGLGSVVMLNVLRLGIKKLIILDYDVVDSHNMNRQLMYSMEDIGKSKVESAIKNARFHNIGQTRIQGHEMDALKNWGVIIRLAQQSDVVYNCIDYGDKFDIAVSSLCIKLKKPLIMGGTFATSMTVDYFPPNGEPCYLCTDQASAANAKHAIQLIKPQHILNLQDITFLPKNNNPIGRSSVIVCTICGQFMVSHFLNYLFLSQEKPYQANRLIFYHNTFQIVKFTLEKQKKCLICGDPNYVQPTIQVKKQPENKKQEQKTQNEKQTEGKQQKVQDQKQEMQNKPQELTQKKETFEVVEKNQILETDKKQE